MNQGEGVILTRNRTNEENRLSLLERKEVKGVRFVVQTNTDHWSESTEKNKANWLLHNSLYRVCQVESFFINSVWTKENVNELAKEAMEQHEVLSAETIYQTFMSPATSAYSSRLTYPPEDRTQTSQTTPR